MEALNPNLNLSGPMLCLGRLLPSKQLSEGSVEVVDGGGVLKEQQYTCNVDERATRIKGW